jgi:hypothetical protein
MITMTCLIGVVVLSSPVCWALKIEAPEINWKSARAAIPMRERCKALDAVFLTDIHSPSGGVSAKQTHIIISAEFSYSMYLP